MLAPAILPCSALSTAAANGIDLIARDERRRCRGEAAFRLRRLAGDDHRVEEQRVALEPDRHRTVSEGHRHVGGGVPDSAHEKRNGHAVDEDGKAAIVSRLGRAAPARRTVITAPDTGCPLPASVTVPLIGRCCATSVAGATRAAMTAQRTRRVGIAPPVSFEVTNHRQQNALTKRTI